MRPKLNMEVLLICLLLSDAVLGVSWQGTGSGMNSTVLTEAWAGITSNLDPALIMNTRSGYSAFCQQISDRLNSRWDPAWNVVLTKSQAIYDTVLYGYAFNSQWMWFNGVPNNVLGSSNIATLIVWKDYNCQSWGNIGEEASGFTGSQRSEINTIISFIDTEDFKTDIWKVAFTLVTQIQSRSTYSIGAYTAIVSQDPQFGMYGRICKKENRFFGSNPMINRSDFIDGKFISDRYGSFFVFQTR